MTSKYQINRWMLSFSHESPNFGKFSLKHDNEEIFFDAHEIHELKEILRLAEAGIGHKS